MRVRYDRPCRHSSVELLASLLPKLAFVWDLKYGEVSIH